MPGIHALRCFSGDDRCNCSDEFNHALHDNLHNTTELLSVNHYFCLQAKRFRACRRMIAQTLVTRCDHHHYTHFNWLATRSGRPALLFDLPARFHAYRLRISDRSGRPALSYRLIHSTQPVSGTVRQQVHYPKLVFPEP